METNGIKRSTIFWPVKIWDKVVLFKLQFWDASENSIKKYSHILPVRIYFSKFSIIKFYRKSIRFTLLYFFRFFFKACKDKVDAICSVFSFDDANTFNDIPQLMNSMAAIKEKPASIVIGTR